VRTLDVLVGDSPLFRGLSDDYLKLIAGCASNAGFEAGDRLFADGDPANVFYLVRHGIVALDTFVPNRGALTVETVGPGEIVGWSWLIPPYRWHFTGRAVEPVRAIQFDGACLRAKAEADAKLGHELTTRFAQMLVARLHATQFQLIDVYGEPDAAVANVR
jgi:CRP/FNR family cyclic AMP-dependent transcriptional regulator